MKDAQRRSRRLKISIRAALAGFLIFGGLQEVVLGARDPLAAGVINVINRFIGKAKPDSFLLSRPEVDWILFAAEVAFGIVLVLFGLKIGLGAAKRQQKQLPS